MPPIINEEHQEDFKVGVWHINEDLAWLEDNHSFSVDETDYYKNFLVESRKKQWLACRHLINDMHVKPGIIYYDTNGKPHFKDKNAHLSYSHSYDYAAVIISDFKPVGIDIERINKRLLKVKERYLSPDELSNIDNVNFLKSLCTLWCAKESLYKLYGKYSLDFKEHIKIAPFKYETKGVLHGSISNEDHSQSYKLYYWEVGEYVLVFVSA